MAAEMNGAAVLLQYTKGQNPSISTYPIKCEANFIKKATDVTTFVCNDGLMVKDKVIEAIETGEGVTFQTKIEGKNKRENYKVHTSFVFTLCTPVRDIVSNDNKYVHNRIFS